jgi:hypothetical protein
MLSSAADGLLDLVERAGERLLGDVGIVAEGQQDLALALEFLHQVELEVGAAGDIEDLEQRHQRDVMLLGTLEPMKCRSCRTGPPGAAVCECAR